MRNKWFILLCVILCFVLSACGAETPPETEQSPDVNAVTAPPDPNLYILMEPKEWSPNLTLPAREDVLAVDVICGMSSLFYMGTNELEKEAFLDLLYAADLSRFKTFEDPEEQIATGQVLSYLLHTADETVEVRILMNRTENVQYLKISGAAQEKVKIGSVDMFHFVTENIKAGPADGFDYNALEELYTQISMNNEDPLHCGRVEIEGSGNTQVLTKIATGEARGDLDNSLALAEIAEDESIDYDVLFTAGEVTYGLNTETGHFYREMDGETVYGQMSEGRRMGVYFRLGIPIKPPQG